MKALTFHYRCKKLIVFRHLHRKHDAAYKEYTSRYQLTDASQPTIDSVMKRDDNGPLGVKHPQQLKFNRSVVNNLIVGCALPMSIVENPNFRAFIHDLNPKLSLPSRQHISYTLIPDLHAQRLMAVKKHLSQVNFISLTLDLWSDRRCHSFMAITGHTFAECIPTNFLLTFQSFKGSHTGVRIAEAVDKCLSDFNIKDKLRFVVTDNASNMRKAFDVLSAMISDEGEEAGVTVNAIDDESLWEDIESTDEERIAAVMSRNGAHRLSCFAHTLQLVVKDGVDKLGSGRSLMSKCSKMANLVHQSIAFREAFEKQFGSSASIPSTNATRWSSLFNQLTSIVDLDSSKLADVLMETSHSNLILTKRENEMLDELVDILSPFAEATDLTQGDKYTTIGCIVPTVVALMKHLASLSDRAVYHGPVIRALQSSMLTRFSGLLSNLKMLHSPGSDRESDQSTSLPFDDPIYLVACVLDPNWGFRWLESDYVGPDEVKMSLRASIIGKLLNMLPQLILCDLSSGF